MKSDNLTRRHHGRGFRLTEDYWMVVEQLIA